MLPRHGSPPRHDDDAVRAALDRMRATLPRATALLDRGQLPAPTVLEPSAEYVANARSALAKEAYVASRTRSRPPRPAAPSPYGAPVMGPPGAVRRRWRLQAAKADIIDGARLEPLLPYATPQITRRRARPASARPVGGGARAAKARRPGSAAASTRLDRVLSNARSTFRGRALAAPKQTAPKPTPFGALKALAGELGVPKSDRDRVTVLVKAQILQGRAPTADRILEAHAELLRRHRADAIATIRACKAREAIVHAALAACAECDDDQVGAVRPFASALDAATGAVQAAVAAWRRRLARPAPFRYRGRLYGEIMAYERRVFASGSKDVVIQWLMRRDNAAGPAEDDEEDVMPAWDLLAKAMDGQIIDVGDERRLRAAVDAERALWAERGEAPPPLLKGWGDADADAALVPLLSGVLEAAEAPAPAPQSTRKKKKKRRNRILRRGYDPLLPRNHVIWQIQHVKALRRSRDDPTSPLKLAAAPAVLAHIEELRRHFDDPTSPLGFAAAPAPASDISWTPAAAVRATLTERCARSRRLFGEFALTDETVDEADAARLDVASAPAPAPVPEAPVPPA